MAAQGERRRPARARKLPRLGCVGAACAFGQSREADGALSSDRLEAAFNQLVCCLAECDDSVQLSTGMKPLAWPSTARLGSVKYMRMPLEKRTNQKCLSWLFSFLPLASVPNSSLSSQPCATLATFSCSMIISWSRKCHCVSSFAELAFSSKVLCPVSIASTLF